MSVSVWNQPQTTIGHLTARYSGSQKSIDRTVLRLRLERLLDNADLGLSGLSSGAVLIARRLSSPVAVSISSLAPPALAGWQTSLREQLAAMYAAAARPVSGAVPPDAPGVLFADPGELLTCLTRDLLNGWAHERWYWQNMLRNLPHAPGDALPLLWSEQAAFLPGVFASLRPSELYNAVTCLAPRAIEQVILALHECFDLAPAALSAMGSRKQENAPFTWATMPGDTAGDEPSAAASPVGNAPPWEQWLPAAALPALSPAASYLPGLCLALHHAPSFARSTRFASRAAAWLRDVSEQRSAATETARRFSGRASDTEPGLQPTPPGKQDRPAEQIATILQEAEQGSIQKHAVEVKSSPLERQATTLFPAVDQSLVVQQGENGLDESSQMIEARSPAHPPTQDKPLMEPGAIPLQETALKQTMQQMQSQATSMMSPLVPSPHITPPAHDVAPSQSPVSGRPAPEERRFVMGVARELPADGVFTSLGGVLYLINLLIRLDLLHNWEEDEALANAASGWAMVDALARCLLWYGGLHESYREDAIWHVLALLEGREPGTAVVTGLPEALPALAHQVFATGSEEASSSPAAESLRMGPNEQVLDWLVRVSGFVYHQLAWMLEISPNEPGRLVQLALCHPGQLIASRTHVDLHMSLEESNIAVRLAGLDCDPGWVPDLGRIVYFHFD